MPSDDRLQRGSGSSGLHRRWFSSDPRDRDWRRHPHGDQRDEGGEGGSRALILLTDGEDHHSDPVEAAKEAARLGMKIYAIGVGTPEGEPIPVFDDQGHRTGYKRDKNGEVVLSRVDERTLIQIAQETGGQYYRASASGDEVEQIARALDSLKKGDQKTQLFNRFENRYQWPLAFGILCLLAGLAIPEEGWRKA